MEEYNDYSRAEEMLRKRKENQIKSICRRLEKIAKELDALDLTLHVVGNCELLTSYSASKGKGEVVATAYTHNWGGGDS